MRKEALRNLYNYLIVNKSAVDIPFSYISLCALAGRVCYTSYPKFEEDKRLNEEIIPYLDKLSKWTHYSVFSHLPVIIHIPEKDYVKYRLYNLFKQYYNPDTETLYLNLRHILEAYNEVSQKGYLSYIVEDLQINPEYIYMRDLLNHSYIKKSDGQIILMYFEYPEKYNYVFYFIGNIIDRAISHQVVRHQALNFNQQSQRYVKLKTKPISYVKIKTMFNFIDKHIKEKLENISLKNCYLSQLNSSFRTYEYLLSKNIPSEKARGVLPNDTATNLVISGFKPDLIKFISDRTSKQAQEEIRILAEYMKKAMEKEL